MFEEWERRYEAIHPPDLSKKSILYAYNLCLDKIKYIDGTSWIPLHRTPAFLKTMDDVYGALLHCMRNGVGHEMAFSDEVLAREIESLGFAEKRLGGQVGIMANLAVMFNAEAVIYPSFVSEEISQLLDPRILVPQNGRLVPVRESRFARNLPHYIFEFKRGMQTNGIDVPTDNRFIASFITESMEYSNDFEEMLSSLAHRTQYSMISGFHLISSTLGKRIVRERIAKIRDHMEILKQNGNHRIHCEMGAMDSGIISNLNKVLPLTDSVGLNETELISLACHYGKETKNNICSLFDAMVFLKDRFCLRRIHMHALGYYICLTQNPHHERDALLLASLAAASRAQHGEIHNISQLEDSKRIPISPQGMHDLTILSQYIGSKDLREEGIEGDVVCIPTSRADPFAVHL